MIASLETSCLPSAFVERMMDHVQLCQKSLRSLQILRDQNDFFDLTLMTDDVHKTYAHKAVLSAFSPFFKNVFDSCNVKYHIYLYLDVRTENLLRILDYIYKGEVSVPSSQIEEFIKAASKLKISELIKVKAEDQENVYGRTHAVRNSSSTIITEEDRRDCQISSNKVEENSTNFSDGDSFQYFRGHHIRI